MNKEKNITTNDIMLAQDTLTLYKRQKLGLEKRLAEEENIWSSVYSDGESSSWIFNSIVNKHADIIDSIPTCTCLPREKRDERDAAMLSKIIPVISQRCEFEQTYSDNAWSKLKHGTSIFGVFWNNAMEGGMGDVDIRGIDVKDVFWDMSVSDVQSSKNLFIIAPVDIEEAEARYPHFKYAEHKDADQHLITNLALQPGDGKALSVDWYYKKYLGDGSSVLHYCKFIGDCVLYSSENDPACANGWYEHGKYPIVFDRMYPMGSAYGFGLIAIATNAQKYINRLDANMLEYTDWASRVRFWAKRSLGVNEKEFLDLERSIVEVEGDIDEEKLRQIEISPIDDTVIDIKRLKIEELKEITGARDVSQGGVTGGVTAASAISILREAGAKSSRDGIEETYRAYVKIISLVIELVRQFYDETRIFRIVGEDGKPEYIEFSGKNLRDDGTGRRPFFDIEINAMKKSPTEAQQKNQFAKALYDSGAFKKENIKETLMMLELMDFEGVGNLKVSLRSEYGE